MTVRLSIAMATYNGEKYLQEQLKSLLYQTRLPNEVVICDDGSRDGTLALLESFAQTAPFPVRIYQNDRNLGYADNFLKAAELCDGDWIAFCDQDDIWFPSKLQSAVDAIEREKNLVLVLQQAELCDDRLNRLGRLFPNSTKPSVYGPNYQYGFWIWPGFLQTVKSEIFAQFDASRRPRKAFLEYVWQSHDKWTCIVANALGGIAVLGRPEALYRRHPTAATLYPRKSLRQRIKDSIAVRAENYCLLAEAARSWGAHLNELAENIPDDDKIRLLRLSAGFFQHLAEIQDHRAELYKTRGVLLRLMVYLRTWQRCGYFGSRFTSMGAKSAIKDAIRVFLGSRIGSSSIESQ